MVLPINYARDFSDKLLNEKYEEELYHNKTIKARIHTLKENMKFYLIAASWLLTILLWPRLSIVIMLVALFLSYKLECLDKKYFYHICVMMMLTVGYVLRDISARFAPFVLTYVLYVILTIVYIVAAVASSLKYIILTKPMFQGLCDFWGCYNLGNQLYYSNDKLYRLESEVNNRKKIEEQLQLSKELELLNATHMDIAKK